MRTVGILLFLISVSFSAKSENSERGVFDGGVFEGEYVLVRAGGTQYCYKEMTVQYDQQARSIWLTDVVSGDFEIYANINGEGVKESGKTFYTQASGNRVRSLTIWSQVRGMQEERLLYLSPDKKVLVYENNYRSENMGSHHSCRWNRK